jgi:hypothetical protein
MNEQNPSELEEFDWVSARAQCTPSSVFERLRAQVKEDVGKRNSLTGDGWEGTSFVFQAGRGYFSVSHKTITRFSGVTFSLTVNGIGVLEINSNTPLHEGVLAISNEGRCVMRVKSAELSLWQFRKLALQDLFFVIGDRPQ